MWTGGSSARRPPAAAGTRSGLPGAHVATDPDTPALRVLHLVAGLATAVVIALGGPAGPLLAPGWHGGAITVCWALGVALVAVSALGAMLLDDPTGGAPHRGGRWLRAALGPRPRRVLHAVAWVSLLVAVALLDRLPVRLPGADLAVQMVAALVALVCVLIALLLVPAALLARRTWSAQPRELRPWAGGWMAAPVVAVAALLGGGFGAGIALSVRQALGHGDLPRRVRLHRAAVGRGRGAGVPGRGGDGGGHGDDAVELPPAGQGVGARGVPVARGARTGREARCAGVVVGAVAAAAQPPRGADHVDGAGGRRGAVGVPAAAGGRRRRRGRGRSSASAWPCWPCWRCRCSGRCTWRHGGRTRRGRSACWRTWRRSGRARRTPWCRRATR